MITRRKLKCKIIVLGLVYTYMAVAKKVGKPMSINWCYNGRGQYKLSYEDGK